MLHAYRVNRFMLSAMVSGQAVLSCTGSCGQSRTKPVISSSVAVPKGQGVVKDRPSSY